jgi:small-conductance mechanosensitive channel
LSDGAHLIIPNGDLLSQQLVNWTMGKNIKRLSITVGVAYGTDLEKSADHTK